MFRRPRSRSEEPGVSQPVWSRIALVAGAAALLGGGAWLAAHLRSLPGAATLAARSNQRIVVLEARGTEPPEVAAAVAAAVRGVPGVTAAEVRPVQARIYVVCEASVPDSALVAAVRATGSGRDARVVLQ